MLDGLLVYQRYTFSIKITMYQILHLSGERSTGPSDVVDCNSIQGCH